MAAVVTIGEIQALATLKDNLSPKLGRLDAKLKKVGGKSGSVGKMAGGLSRMGLAAGPAIGALTALAAGASAFAVKGLAFNKAVETATTRFIAFTGSAEKAHLHVGRLTKFAAETPFQLPGILAASRQLQVFGADAVYGRDTLKLIGDAAAGVGQPLQDVSMWVGRMYTALKAGQPIGEATARLQEMGLLSGPALTALREMAKEGGRTEEAMELLRTEIGKHAGGMKRLSETTEGLESTFSDLSAQSAGLFADAIGLTSTYKQGLKVINGMLGGMIDLVSTPIPRQSDPVVLGGMSVSEWREGLKEVGDARRTSWEQMHAEYLRKQKEYALIEKNEAERLAILEAERVAQLKVDRFWAKAEAKHLIGQAQTMAVVEAQGIPLVGGMGTNFAEAFNAGMVSGPGGLMETLPPGMELVGGTGLEDFKEITDEGSKKTAMSFGKQFMGPFSSFINGDFLSGAKSMVSGFANILLPGLGSLVGPAMKIIGKIFSFGGPSEAEQAARDDVDAYEETFIKGLNAGQIQEARGAGWESWEDAAFLIGIRDAYTAGGKSAAQAESDVNRYWAAIKAEDQSTIDYYQAMWDRLPGRAVGGPVMSGQPYVVGERGPEVFVPSHSGGIVPNGGIIDYRRMAEAIADALQRSPARAVISRGEVTRAVIGQLALTRAGV